MRLNGELQVKQDGLTVGIKRQLEELKTLDAEVAKKNQEEIETLKSQNLKANESLKIMAKIESSIKTHYKDQELKVLEGQYEAM